MINQNNNAKNRKTASTGKRPASQRPSGQRPSNQRPVSQRPAGQGASAQRRPVPQKKQRRFSPVLITLIVALVLAIGVFAGLGIYVMRYNNYDKILPNVYVAGVDVGGMTKAEATQAINSALAVTEQQSVNVVFPDRSVAFTPQQDTILVNVDQAVDEAYAYGRASTSPFAIARAIKAAQRTRNDIDITSAVQVDTAYIDALINETAAAVEEALVESDVQTDMEAHTITVTIGSPGRSFDKDRLKELVISAFTNGDYSDISFDYKMTYPATVQLDTLYDQMTTEAKNAEYDVKTKAITDEVVGYVPATELDKANEELATASSGDVLTFYFNETQPEVTAAQLSELLFRDTLAEYGSTYYSGNYGRTRNLELACEAIDGTVINPGQTFSFNDVVGERTAAKGYRAATVYVGTQSKDELGGGICQVASTIYDAALYAEMTITSRACHTFFVTYVPGGLDATVYWGSLDFCFRNDTDYPIRVNASVSGGYVNISIDGTKTNDHVVKLSSTRLATEPYSTVYREDSSKPAGYEEETTYPYTGYTYEAYQYIYDGNGNLLESNYLGKSTYDKRDRVITVGTG